MTTLLHIIHPYTYKLERMGGPLIIGELEQFKERDQRVHEFVKRAKGTGIDTLVYWEVPSERIFFSLGAIILDERLKIMLPSTHAISTPYCGRPKNLPGYTSPKAYDEIVTPYERHLFIGGLLEACIPDAVCYTRGLSSAPITIIEDLCVSFEHEYAEHLKQTLFPAKEIELAQSLSF